MRKQKCELCGREDETGTIKRYPVFPQEIVEEAGVERSKIIRLCPDCRQELDKWYSTKVALQTYDNGTKQFRPKSAQELLKEYEIAYTHFTRYKKVET